MSVMSSHVLMHTNAHQHACAQRERSHSDTPFSNMRYILTCLCSARRQGCYGKQPSRGIKEKWHGQEMLRDSHGHQFDPQHGLTGLALGGSVAQEFGGLPLMLRASMFPTAARNSIAVMHFGNR